MLNIMQTSDGSDERCFVGCVYLDIWRLYVVVWMIHGKGDRRLTCGVLGAEGVRQQGGHQEGMVVGSGKNPCKSRWGAGRTRITDNVYLFTALRA